MSKVTKEQMVAVAVAFNNLGCNPPIAAQADEAGIVVKGPEHLDEKALETGVKEFIGQLTQSDQLSMDVQRTLVLMGHDQFPCRTITDEQVKEEPKQEETTPQEEDGVSRADLLAAAKDINQNVPGLSPKIKTVAVKDVYLLDTLKAVVKQGAIRPEDKLTDATKATLKAIGAAAPEAKVKGRKGRPAGSGKGPVKAKEGVNQTDAIRALIKASKDRVKVIAGLAAEVYGGSETKANARLKIYEKAYGEMGVNDKKLAAAA